MERDFTPHPPPKLYCGGVSAVRGEGEVFSWPISSPGAGAGAGELVSRPGGRACTQREHRKACPGPRGEGGFRPHLDVMSTFLPSLPSGPSPPPGYGHQDMATRLWHCHSTLATQTLGAMGEFRSKTFFFLNKYQWSS